MRKHLSLVLASAILVLSFQTPSSAEDADWRTLEKSGEAAAANGDFLKALPLFHTAVEVAKRSNAPVQEQVDLNYRIAESIRSGAKSAVIAVDEIYYANMVDLYDAHPELGEIPLERMVQYASASHPRREAEAVYQRAIKAFKKHPNLTRPERFDLSNIYVGLAESEAGRGKNKLAEKNYRRAISVCKNDSAYWDEELWKKLQVFYRCSNQVNKANHAAEEVAVAHKTFMSGSR